MERPYTLLTDSEKAVAAERGQTFALRTRMAGPWLGATWESVREPFWIFLGTRVGLFLVAYLGLALLPLRSGDHWRPFVDNLFLDGWARWDTGWYVSIADRGYYFSTTGASSVPFFPLYPMLIKAVGLLVRNNVLAAILVSNLALLLALVMLHRLVLDRFGPDIARKTVLLVCVFPFAMFYSAAYSESVFLLLCVATFYFGERRRWAMAAAAAGLASASRLVGILAACSLALLYLESIGYDVKRIRRDAAWLILSTVGLLGYLGFLWARFGSPLVFAEATHIGWNHPGLFDYQTHRTVLNLLLTADYSSGKLMFPSESGLILGTAFLLAAVVCIWRLRPAYWAFAFLVVFIPYSTANMDSMARYITVAFPVFIFAASLLRSEVATQVVLFVSTLLLALCTILFANWYWIG